MSRRYPEHLSLLSINSRLWDLMKSLEIMLALPEFKGSYSIKNILPVLVLNLPQGMPIANGSVAMTKWVQMVYGGGITAMDYSESEDFLQSYRYS